ncbi:MAG: ATPase, T2SS/T4P/T4SS family [Planctomycetota bacterium]
MVQKGPNRKSAQLPIGAYFVESGKITREQLEEALEHKRTSGGKIGQALVQLGFVTEADLTNALRQQGRIYCINLSHGILNSTLAAEFGEAQSRRHRAVIVNRIAGYTTVAMEDPTDIYAIDEIQLRVGTRIHPVFAEPSSIDEAIDYIFSLDGVRVDRGGSSVEMLAERARSEAAASSVALDLPVNPGGKMRIKRDANPATVELAGIDQDEQEQVEEVVDDKPVVNLVRSILSEAFREGASDIHLEPGPDSFTVRFRIDGSCYEKTTVPVAWARPVIARIKIMASLDIAQRRLPQDGRTQFKVGDTRVDLRVATTPTIHGEGAVLRILDGGRQLEDLSSLNLRDEQRAKLSKIIRCREGFVLATGPTGSGKTTTLYALLKELADPERKIVTLEDPVENVLAGITQINANPKAGLTFAKGLRSILRQDPDIVLVGEIRDEETAGIAVEASMTGHIVLSTLHTVGAVESISRLADMGVEPYLLGDTLKGVIAQRLLRKLCTDCRKPMTPPAELLAELGLGAVEGATFFEHVGCEACRHTGYKGRVAIYEILEVDPEMRALVQSNANTDRIHEHALAHGLETLRTDGLRKAVAGEVTLNDVLSSTS